MADSTSSKAVDREAGVTGGAPGPDSRVAPEWSSNPRGTDVPTWAGLSAQGIRRSTALAKTDYDFSATADPPYPASRGPDMRAKLNKVSSELVLSRT